MRVYTSELNPINLAASDLSHNTVHDLRETPSSNTSIPHMCHVARAQPGERRASNAERWTPPAGARSALQRRAEAAVERGEAEEAEEQQEQQQRAEVLGR